MTAAFRIDPDDADAHYQLAIHVFEKDPKAARRHLEITLEKIPHHESACYRLHTLLRRAGEKEEAREVLLRFRDLKSSGAGVVREMKYGEMGRYALAVRAFEEPPVDGGPDAPPSFKNVAQEAGLALNSTGTGGWPGDRVDGKRVSFGPGAASADVDSDGDLDLFVPGLSQAGSGTLYLNESGQFTEAGESGIDGLRGIAAYFGGVKIPAHRKSAL